MVKYEVMLTDGAQGDLEAIYDYISEFDCEQSADHVLVQLMKAVSGLSQWPERGNYPRELSSLGIKEYCQVAFKPYRVIYRILSKQVVIFLIADGRRDMQTLLENRLLSR
ncbi:type II toxin-antitoxin system RelE/ParE family toxin [Pandoraea pulmonicola]|uniref:Toxin RelE4 n=2 Tax=Pandoraea pulmonicola TaxID=93221 RepID=A0AAJ4ZDR6_PANPU|nr:type II toxin-antitoxin system RelE/ParE family toxin [Pandoraea pulmonicola]SUA91589.1 Toxin RelE4 [Pandoraea pulmonicola]